jgi:hypothetical protein
MNAKEMTHCATCFILVLLILSLTSCSSHNLGTDLAIIVSDRHVIQAGASDGMYNQTPAVVEAADGDYVLTYRKGPNHVNSPQVVLRRSSDKGITWTPEIVMWDTSTPDPALARTPGGDLLIEFGKLNPQSVSGAAYGRSLDNGLTWSSFTFFDNPVSNTSFVGELYINDGSLMYAPAYGPHGEEMFVGLGFRTECAGRFDP